jgi:hypothetical protein
VTGFFTFFNISIFQTMEVLLTVLASYGKQESMTHFNIEWGILIPNIWLVAKYWYFSKEA